MPFRSIMLTALSLLCLSTHGEEAKPQTVASARCEKEVCEYLDVLQFICNAAGSSIGCRGAAGYVDEKTVREIQDKQGSCAAAELIRAKTATRPS